MDQYQNFTIATPNADCHPQRRLSTKSLSKFSQITLDACSKVSAEVFRRFADILEFKPGLFVCCHGHHRLLGSLTPNLLKRTFVSVG